MKFANLLISNLDDAYAEAIIDSIEAHFDYQEVEENGLMATYNDVLPYGDQLLVIINAKYHLIFNQYCVLPGCPCGSGKKYKQCCLGKSN